MKLTITQQNIKEAKNDNGFCPVEIALLEAGYSFVGAGHIYGYGTLNKKKSRFQFSRNLQSQIKVFDSDGEFKPGTYTLTEYDL